MAYETMQLQVCRLIAMLYIQHWDQNASYRLVIIKGILQY